MTVSSSHRSPKKASEWAKSAGIFTVQIIATAHKRLQEKLRAYKKT